MVKICAVVLNSVSRDARVLKQAESLAAAGYDITIFGIQDKNYNKPEEVTSGGVTIKRCSYASYRFDPKRLRISLFGFLVGLALFAQYCGLLNILSVINNIFFIISLLLLSFWGLRYSLLSPSGNTTSGQVQKRTSWPRAIAIYLNYFLRLIPLGKSILVAHPDVIHCHDIHTLPIGIYLKFKLKCKIVYDAHEIYEEVAQGTSGTRWKYKIIHRLTQRYIDHFITINTSIAEWYAKAYPKLPKARIIMNACLKIGDIDYDLRLHEAAGLPRGAKILLYQGGFALHRGLEYLVESTEYFPDNWYLVMMGWGAAFEDIIKSKAELINSKLVNREGGDVIRFIPPAPQKELVYWTAGATIGIIAYDNVCLNHWFCTPNKLWEYPGAHVPLLVSPFPELKRPLEKYNHGWLLPEDLQPQSIGLLLENLTENDIAEARKNAACFISENHWGVYEAELLTLYSSIEC